MDEGEGRKLSSSVISCVPFQQTSLTIQFVFQGIYGFLSIVLFILNIFALRRLKDRIHKTFSLLYTISAICSSIFFPTHFFLKRFLKLGYFCREIHAFLGDPNWFVTFFDRIPATYCPVFILVLHSLISFHRVTAVVFPMRSSTLWNRYLLPITLCSFLVPVAFMWYVIPCKGWTFFFKHGGLAFEYERIDTFFGPLRYSFFSAAAGFIFGTATLVNTIVIFVCVTGKHIKTDKGMMVFEVYLALFTLIYVISQAIYFSTYYFPSGDVVRDFLEMNNPYLIDLFILPEAWTLLLCNKGIRRETTRIIFLGRSSFRGSTAVVDVGTKRTGSSQNL